MKARGLLEALDGVDPDVEVIFDDDGGNFFDFTEVEWRRMVHITWVDDSESWWPPERVTEDVRVDVKASVELDVLVLR